ncbi:MAG: ABC transporter ATP-binding protein/permease [Oscillospiraceae bacterium]|jgi:putative ABC transport system permease protein|nr:ABC transporter ATP-binding protein/permease [Oscillospiraceae bacterium]
MLKLTGITKDYVMGDTTVHALRGIDIEFRRSEFVAVLGPSGCGKTTLLNIIGGLDRYTAGDLIIDGVRTKEYKDGDWDIYRNKSVGFVFQTYNLIPHQSVLSNVELALTLSGVSSAERKKRAKEALESVGLGDQLNKKPNQMSGGQMQRVAIARALVNNPEILLADEPTGALDMDTGVSIMEILKEISRDRLVIMVTHNPELADTYATRVIRLIDGKIVNDSSPAEVLDSDNSAHKLKEKKNRKKPLGLGTALALSLNNLLTKKARTILTGFAGSIGIIGIALILALSSGMQNYIARVERETVSGYPIIVNSTSMDITAMMAAMGGARRSSGTHDMDKIYSKEVIASALSRVNSRTSTNDLASFKTFLDGSAEIAANSSDIQYEYDTTLTIYKADTSKGVVKLEPSAMMEQMTPSAASASPMSSMFTSGSEAWVRLIDDDDSLAATYTVLAGRMPAAWNELIIIADENNEINDYMLYSLGLRDSSELLRMMMSIGTGGKIDVQRSEYTYEELLALTYKSVAPTDVFAKTETGWADRSSDNSFMKNVVDNAAELVVVGIVRQASEGGLTGGSGAVGYTNELLVRLRETVDESEIARAQLDNPDTDVFTGEAFGAASSYGDNIKKLGVSDEAHPSSVSIYPKNFDSKAKITDAIAAYNSQMSESGQEDKVIQYTDITQLLMSSVESVISGISAVLIAFVAISLVVSSIMIGIITYISVLERTKEIGILRAIGASKSDISRVFNAETLIVGFLAGALGIGITLVLCIPANAIIESLSQISGAAELPIQGGIALILVSMALTFIAGLIPSRVAAKKDPVVALRTE